MHVLIYATLTIPICGGKLTVKQYEWIVIMCVSARSVFACVCLIKLFLSLNDDNKNNVMLLCVWDKQVPGGLMCPRTDYIYILYIFYIYIAIYSYMLLCVHVCVG